LSSSAWSQDRGVTADTGGPPPQPQQSSGSSTTPPAALTAAGALPGEPQSDVPPANERVTLGEAVNRALKRNPNALVAKEEIDRSYGLMEEARSYALPTLYGNALYNQTHGSVSLTGPVTSPQGANIGTASVAYSGPHLLTGNVLLTLPVIAPTRWANWDRAGENLDIAKANEKDVRRTVAIATARAYLTVIAQRRLLAAAELARTDAKGHYDYAHARLVGGIGNRIDEVRAAQELQTDDAQVKSSETGVIRAREALSVLAGVDDVIDAQSDTRLADAPPQKQVSDDVLRARADIAADIHRKRSADRSVDQDFADYLPTLYASGGPTFQTPTAPGYPNASWEIQLSLSVPFYDGGLRYGQAKERKALADEAQTQLEGSMRQARSDVRSGYFSLDRAEAGLVSARAAAKSAKDALDLANIAYRAGAVTNIEVIDAEQSFRDAEVNAAVAEDAARQARLDVLAATGVFP
jgi:outer membrane protein TolC